jgi:hypothetical protein
MLAKAPARAAEAMSAVVEATAIVLRSIVGGVTMTKAWVGLDLGQIQGVGSN